MKLKVRREFPNVWGEYKKIPIYIVYNILVKC